MKDYIVSETPSYKDAFINLLKGSYALVKRDDIFQNVIDFCSGFDMSLDFTLAVKNDVLSYIFKSNHELKEFRKFDFINEVKELLKTKGVSLDYLKRYCLDRDEDGWPKFYIFTNRATYTYHAYLTNEYEEESDFLSAFPDRHFRTVDDICLTYGIAYHKAKNKKLTIVQLYGGHFTGDDGMQNHIALVMIFDNRFPEVSKFLREACEYETSLLKESRIALNEDYIETIETGDLEKSDVEVDKDDDLNNYDLVVGMTLKYNRRLKEEIVSSIERVLDRMSFIRKHTSVFANPDKLPNGCMDWSADKDNDEMAPIRFGIDADFRFVKEMVQFLILLQKATVDQESNSRTRIELDNQKMDMHTVFSKFNRLSTLLLNQKENTDYFDYTTVDQAYRKLMTMFFVATGKKYDPVMAMRKAFSLYDDQYVFLEGVRDELNWGTKNVSEEYFKRDMKKRYSFDISRAALRNGFNTTAHVYVRLFGADVMLPDIVEAIGIADFKKMTSEILTVEKIIYNRCII